MSAAPDTLRECLAPSVVVVSSCRSSDMNMTRPDAETESHRTRRVAKRQNGDAAFEQCVRGRRGQLQDSAEKQYMI